MVHGQEADSYTYLASSRVSEVTIAQLEQALENTFISKKNVEAWKAAITVSRLLETSRTYPHGISIPNESVIGTSPAIAGGGFHDFTPPGSEVWQVIGLMGTSASGTPDTLVTLTDGLAFVITHSAYAVGTGGLNIFHFESPFNITPTCWLRIINQDLSIEQTYVIAYHKVSL